MFLKSLACEECENLKFHQKGKSSDCSHWKEKLVAKVESVGAAAEGKPRQVCSAAGIIPSAHPPSSATCLSTE